MSVQILLPGRIINVQIYIFPPLQLLFFIYFLLNFATYYSRVWQEQVDWLFVVFETNFTNIFWGVNIEMHEECVNIGHHNMSEYLAFTAGMTEHRFSAFWLKSKCSLCSYLILQPNIWYVLHWGTSILNWFLDLGEDAGACSDLPTGWPSELPNNSNSKQAIIS